MNPNPRPNPNPNPNPNPDRLFEPDRFGCASGTCRNDSNGQVSAIQPIFDQYFGATAAERRRVCAIGWEPNPHHRARLTGLAGRYNALGWRTTFMQSAASVKDGEVRFFFDMVGKRSHNEWGASTISSRLNLGRNRTAAGVLKQSAVVSTVDIAAWFRREVLTRQLPRSDGGRPARIVMKVDIEGGEFELLPHLLASGVLCEVDYVYVEFHLTWVADGTAKAKAFTGNLTALKEARGASCPIEFTHLDDEAFGSDDIPLP